MTSICSVSSVTSAPASAVRLVLIGPVTATSPTLRAALDARPGPAAVWEILLAGSPDQDPIDCAHIAVCSGAAGAHTARTVWPSATVVALVPAHDDGTATMAALHAGAHVCVRGNDPVLIAAYLQSIARRRSLIVGVGKR